MTATLTQTKPDEMAILREAVDALQRHDSAKKTLKDIEADLSRLCRDYGVAAGVWGFSPVHLRRACEARGLI